MTFRKAILWSVGGQAVSYSILFICSVIVARLLSPREMGIFAIAMATIGILNVLVAFNIGTYIIREKALEQRMVDTAFTVNAATAMTVAIAIALCSLFERYVFHSPDVARVLLPLAITPLIGIFEFRAAAMLQREMNFRILSIVQTFKGLIAAGTVITLALNGFSYMSLAYGNVVAALLSAIWINGIAPRHMSFRFSLVGARSMVTFGIRMMSIGGLATLSSRLADVILGYVLGLASLGLYSRASSISALVFENIYGAITRVVFVRMSEDYRTKQTIRSTFLRSFQLILATLWPIQIGLAIFSGPFIYYLYGQRWLPAATPLSLLMIAQTITLCFGMNWELFVLKDETAKQTRLEVLRSTIGLAFFAICCMFGITAAALGKIAEAILGVVLYRPHINRLAEVEHGCIERIILQSGVLTVAATAPALILMVTNHWSHLIPIGQIIASIIVGILLWLATLAGLRHPMMGEFDVIVRKFVPKNSSG